MASVRCYHHPNDQACFCEAQRLYALHHSEPSDAEAVVPSHTDAVRNNAALLVARGLSTQAYANRMVHQADWLDGQLAACEVAPQIRFGGRP